MQAFLLSVALAALAEMGDRTQLLALLLTARFRRPWAVLGGMAVGVVANHLLAATAGFYLSSLLDAAWFRRLIALTFVGMALWILLSRERGEIGRDGAGAGAFATAMTASFLLEMGDKTQVATAALAARFHGITLVTLGTTLGVLLAAAPAVLLGEEGARFLPLKALRIGGAVSYLALGVWGLVRG